MGWVLFVYFKQKYHIFEALAYHYLFSFEKPSNPLTMAIPIIQYLWVFWVSVYLAKTFRQRRNGRHYTDDIFNCIFFNQNVWIPIQISLKFVPNGPINNIPALVQIMAWWWPGDKPLSERWLVYRHIYASLGLNELTSSVNSTLAVGLVWIYMCGGNTTIIQRPLTVLCTTIMASILLAACHWVLVSRLWKCLTVCCNSSVCLVCLQSII